MTAYYNEHDKFAAAWLRNLIAAGHIAPGDVDERDIQDVRPDDLAGYTQCHFFAGIGGWSRALRLAGWPDDRAVWTGSCPCQPFSAAGKGAGFADERHLWPSWFWLIEQCKPATVFGEQVASRDALDWLDVVQSDLEGAGYAVGVADLCAAGFGAPHIRQRLWFVADSARERWDRFAATAESHGRGFAQADGAIGGMADALPTGRPERWSVAGDRSLAGRSIPLGVGDANVPDTNGWAPGWQQSLRDRGAVRGFWGDADWIYCRDATVRPVGPGTFPLAASVPARMGRLRGYGNAISPEVGAAFIRATM